MAGVVVGRAWRVGAVALLLPCACEVHGLVGSNLTGSPVEPTSGGDESTSGGSGGAVGTTTTGVADGSSGRAAEEGEDSVGGTTEALAFDVSPGDGPEVCLAPLPTVCDHASDDPWRAMGVGCPGSVSGAITSFTGHPSALYVQRGQLGTHGEYAPREGERMVILSTGRASDVPRTHAELGCDPLLCPSSAFDIGGPMTSLPPPMNVSPVHGSKTCAEDPSLVGTGDCSNTLGTQWTGGGALDYAELRMTAKVPDTADALVYELAFFSAEYPAWINQGSPWNDMYVAWLESEAWTGNISFDAYGNPIATNGVFLDYLDADSPLCDRSPCVAPELDGFAMDGHAGTRWLETVAPVVPGEEIEMIFAIFDLSDAHFDSVVLLDAVHWGCTDLPPLTQPQG